MHPPILLVHGACSRASHMEPWARYFRAAGHEVVAPTLSGHGEDDQALLVAASFADYVEALREVHARFDQPPVVIGHSMGGLLAQHLAAQAECAAIVLVASAPPFALTAKPRAIRHGLPLAWPVLRGRSFRPEKKALATLVLHDLSAQERNELLADFSAESGRAFRAIVFGRAALLPGAVKCPVLVVNGSEDRLMSQRLYRRIALRYRADHIVVAGRGHWLMAESLVSTVAAQVLAWIERLAESHSPGSQASFQSGPAL